MAVTQRFRSAFHGFNREDVVNYIEYLNNQHVAQINQLNTQLQEAKGAVSAEELADLQAQLDAALQRCADLEEQLQVKEATANKELEAYRRAEEAERKANERAQMIYAQANTVLTDATAMAEAAAEEFNRVAERTSQQLKEYQFSITAAVNSFKAAANSLNSVKPE